MTSNYEDIISGSLFYRMIDLHQLLTCLSPPTRADEVGAQSGREYNYVHTE